MQSVFSVQENLSHARGTEWQKAAAGTNSGAIATQPAAANVIHKIFWVQFFTDADSILQILDDTTVEWEGKLDVDVAGWNYPFYFPVPLIGSSGKKVVAKIASSSSDCHVSFGGFSTRN